MSEDTYEVAELKKENRELQEANDWFASRLAVRRGLIDRIEAIPLRLLRRMEPADVSRETLLQCVSLLDDILKDERGEEAFYADTEPTGFTKVKAAPEYIVVGGAPYKGYTGTVTFGSLSVVGRFSNLKDASQCVVDKWDECGGLITIVGPNTEEV